MTTTSGQPDLNSDQTTILEGLARSDDYKTIGRATGNRTVDFVRAQVAKMLRLFQVSSEHELVLAAYELGIINELSGNSNAVLLAKVLQNEKRPALTVVSDDDEPDEAPDQTSLLVDSIGDAVRTAIDEANIRRFTSGMTLRTETVVQEERLASTAAISDRGTTIHTAKEFRITPRELEVIQCLADGMSTPEIAQQLFISAKTVKNHLASVYQKTGERTQLKAVIFCVRLGIVDID